MNWEIKKWFGSPIFITRLEDFQSINQNILELIKKDIKPYNTKFARTTDVDLTDSSKVRDDLHHNPQFDILFTEIQKQIYFFLEQHQYRMDIFDAYITKAWATFSTQGQSIDRHSHTASHYSLIYYVEAEDQGNVVFDDENGLRGTMYIPPSDKYYKNWTDLNFSTVTYPSQTGNLIIFPSELKHYTQQNTKDSPRISISADLLLTIKEGIKSEHCLPSPNTWKKI
tara:strand:- start:781 stop:1458 length:678 start_codon:yes stop_codon:yes gene_type:complete